MSGNISFNPMQTLGANTSFLLETDGWVQGTYFDDPALRYELAGGFYAAGQAHPLWGGLPVSLNVPAVGSNNMGPSVALATDNAGIAGWSVFNQAHHMLLTPGSTVPLAQSGMSAMFIRFRSGLRLAVQLDPSIVNTVDTGAETQQLSWDFTNNRLAAYDSTTGALNVRVLMVNNNSKVVNYNATSGAVTWNDAGSAAVILV